VWLNPNPPTFELAAFNLQTAPEITGNFTNIPDATSPYTHPVTGGRRFFRLIGN